MNKSAAAKPQKDASVKSGKEQRFFEAGRDWEADREAERVKSARTAWTVAAGSLVLVGILAISLALMAPFKKVVPYVFAVDKATGNVELVSAADDRTVMGYQELQDKFWGSRYVIARESYYWKLLQLDYDTVLGLSADDVGREYAKAFDGANSKDKKLGAGVEQRVEIRSVVLARDGVGTKAVVRFERTQRRVESNTSEAPQVFVATFSYEFKPSMFGKEKDLISNPLGYRVTSYRVDAEMSAAPVVASPKQAL